MKPPGSPKSKVASPGMYRLKSNGVVRRGRPIPTQSIPLTDSIAKGVRGTREAKHLTRNDLAALTGLSSRTIESVEIQDRPKINVDVLKAIERALQTTFA